MHTGPPNSQWLLQAAWIMGEHAKNYNIQFETNIHEL